MRSVLNWGKLCLLLSVAAAQSDADRMQQVMSFREPAQRVQQVLQKLSQRTDVRLVAAPDLRDEIVLIDVEQLPLQQILNALAIALDAEWQLQSDGSYRLYRPLSKAQRRRALEREQWARRWREELAKHAPERLDATLTEADARPAFRRIRETLAEALARPEARFYEVANEENFDKPCQVINPLQRLIHRLLNLMDWNELAQTPPNEVRIYSNRPGAFARPFPKPLAPLIQQLQQEVALYERLKRDSKDGFADLLSTDAVQRFRYFIDFSLPALNPLQGADDLTITLVVEHSPADLPTFYLFLMTPERDGRVLLHQGYAIVLEEPPFSHAAPDEKWRSCKIEWSERSRLQLRLLNGNADAVAPEQLAALDPARVEPLSLTASDILSAYARCRRKPLVALLPDLAANPVWQLREDFLPENAPLGALEQYLAQWEWIEGAVLIAKPRHAAHLWGKRARRNALKPLIEQVQRRGHLNPLEDEMLAATIAPDSDSYRAVSWWLRAHGVNIFFEPDRIALVRGISPPLWNRLIAGETLTLDELPPALIQQLNRFCTQRALGALIRIGETDLPSTAVLYQNGLPLKTRLRLQVETDIGFFTKNRHGVWYGFRDYEEAQRIAQTNPDEQTNEFLRNYYQRERQLLQREVQYARRTLYTLELTPPAPEGMRIQIGLPSRYERIGKPTRWDAPPDEVKAEIEPLRHRKEFEKQP